MKQIKLLLTSVIIISLMLAGCTDDEPALEISAVSIEGSTLTFVEGLTYDLSTLLKISGADAAQAVMTYTTGDASIASVSGSELTAVKIGATMLTASEATAKLSTTVNVSVIANLVDVTGVTLDQSEAALKIGETVQLVATIAPEDASEKRVTWSVDYPATAKTNVDVPSDIATVTNEGLVKAISAGTVVVTATSIDGEFTASSTITVSNIAVETIVIDPDPVTININETKQISTTVTPANATDQTITWSVEMVDSPDVANYLEISSDGLLKAIARCDECAFIAKATSADGKVSSQIDVTINYVPVTNIFIDPCNLFSVHKGYTKQLVYTVLPENASDKTINWKINHEGGDDLCGLSSINFDDYATIDANGMITAIDQYFNDCSYDLTVEATSADLTDPVIVPFDVTIPVSSLQILNAVGADAGESMSRSGCSSYQFGVSVSPRAPSDNTVTWSVDNEDTLTIDETGLITFKSLTIGHSSTTKITVTANDGSGATDSIDIIVNYSGC